MKLSFSTENVDRSSFSMLCNLASEYGYEGFEIYDAIGERLGHKDSLLRLECSSSAKNTLHNTGVSVCALRVKNPIDCNDVTDNTLVQYVDMASCGGIENVIVYLSKEVDCEYLKKKFCVAIRRAEELDISILIESCFFYSDTEKLIDLIKNIESPVFGASWNVCDTFCNAKESAETTIKTLGAYIRHVRLGDKNENGDKILLGEGNLPVTDVINALNALNYEGFVTSDSCDINDADIFLTSFRNVVMSVCKNPDKDSKVFTNRYRTGTFPYKRFSTLDCTFADVLDKMAETYPDQYAFKYTTLDYTRTYKQFRRDVDTVAASLIALGVKPGYHVAIWATNIPQWFLAFWASAKIGAVLVTVNTAYKIHELEYLLRQSDTHTLIMIESMKDINYKEIISTLCPELSSHDAEKPLFSHSLPFLKYVVTVGFEMNGALTWNRMLDMSNKIPIGEVRRRASLVKPDDVCNMQYTSGTTGFPKGVMLTHRNIINDGKIIGDRMDLSTADRMMIQVPMFHCFGMVLSMTSSMTHAATLCPLPYFSPKSSLSCINAERITCFNGVPTMFIAMFNHQDFKSTDFSYMRTGIMAGANCPADLMKRASIEMNMKEIISVYGQTEASPGCTMGDVNESLEKRTETVGSAFPGVECKIIDPETGLEVPDGTNGEFVARGFNIMKGYYKMPEATSKTIDSDGWLHSGDICCRTTDGYYRVTGRLKDMIIRGGENIYPREIEEFYLTNPKVRDVQVVGVSDKVYGEEACAWIILHEGQSSNEDEMRAYGNASIARHKVPRYFIFTNTFPMNAAGKILKYRMKEESEKRLGL